MQYQGEGPPSRASDADREHVLDLLRAAAVEGRLSHETFVIRMESVLAARSHSQLRSAIEDLPGAEVAPPAVAAASGGLRRLLGRAAAAPGSLAARVRRRYRIRRLPVLALPAGAQTLVIGRSPGSGLRLSHETVSRSHAVLICAADGWSLRDLSSLNGTLVNGRRLVGQAPVRPGDWVAFGKMHFRLAAP